ncbi:MAG: mechanosensitive ion channel [Candidatus Omnitrophica bacterium]|nr:mechanosensitive ion channel [Candidatus Omnitrophota bacterium]
MEDLILKIKEYILLYGIKVIAAILIFVIGKFLAGLLTGGLKKVMLKAKVEETLVSFVHNIAYVGAMTFVVIAAIGQLGVQTTSFIAVLGAAGLAVGLALQGSLSNFAAGVILILFKPFKVNDFIIAGGEMGTVKEIQIFNTVLAHPDNRKIVVPNSQVTGATITNFSAIDKRRIDLVFGISYTDDMKKAKDALARAVASDKRILTEPKPVIAVSELAESSVNLVCRPWVKPGDYWDVYFNIVEQGKLELEKSGITIPFPQRDIHVYEEKKG